MAGESTRIRIGVHARSDVGAIAQLIAPVLGLPASQLAAQLAEGTVLAGPFTRTNAEELAEALSSFGVGARLEAEGMGITTTQDGMPRLSRSQLMRHRAHRASSGDTARSHPGSKTTGRYMVRSGEMTTLERVKRSAG